MAHICHLWKFLAAAHNKCVKYIREIQICRRELDKENHLRVLVHMSTLHNVHCIEIC